MNPANFRSEVSSSVAPRFHPVPMEHARSARSGVIQAVLALSVLLLHMGRMIAGEATPALRRNQLQLGLDPNRATWTQWCVLPEIGPSRAREIVHYREARRSPNGAGRIVFRDLNDLEAVPGLGRKTVARVAPWLDFSTATPVNKARTDFPLHDRIGVRSSVETRSSE